MKGMTSAEVIKAVTEQSTTRKIYMMAIKAKESGKTFEEFITELETLANDNQ